VGAVWLYWEVLLTVWLWWDVRRRIPCIVVVTVTNRLCALCAAPTPTLFIILFGLTHRLVLRLVSISLYYITHLGLARLVLGPPAEGQGGAAPGGAGDDCRARYRLGCGGSGGR